jgi:hypothetical protein
VLKQTEKMQSIGAYATLLAPVKDRFRHFAAWAGEVAKIRRSFFPIKSGKIPAAHGLRSLSYPMLGSEIVRPVSYE